MQGIRSAQGVAFSRDGDGANFCRVLPNPIGQRVYVAETWFGEHLPAARAQLYSFDTPLAASPA